MKFVRRLLWFIASHMVIVSVILLVIVMVFYLSMNAANIAIILDDGMRMRTSVILTREDAAQLNNYFRADFLSKDEALNIGISSESPYINYKIDGFEDQMSLEWVWSWPWEDTAQATIIYRVPTIKGKALSSKSDLVKAGKLAETPPPWQGGRFRMTFIRTDGQWKIAGMTQTQIILEPTPAPTPVPTPATQQ